MPEARLDRDDEPYSRIDDRLHGVRLARDTVSVLDELPLNELPEEARVPDACGEAGSVAVELQERGFRAYRR